MIGYRIMKLQDGGYLVGLYSPQDNGMYNPPVFACTKVSEALEYIREHIDIETRKSS